MLLASKPLLYQEIANSLAISDSNARTLLYGLKKQGLVSVSGARGLSLWSLTRKGQERLDLYRRKERAGGDKND